MIFDITMMSEWDHGLCQVSVNRTRYLLEEERAAARGVCSVWGVFSHRFRCVIINSELMDTGSTCGSGLGSSIILIIVYHSDSLRCLSCFPEAFTQILEIPGRTRQEKQVIWHTGKWFHVLTHLHPGCWRWLALLLQGALEESKKNHRENQHQLFTSPHWLAASR